MLNVLDLFSGSGELGRAFAEALHESCGVRTRTAVYCEFADYPAAVLLSRMLRGEIDSAPIQRDIRTLEIERRGGEWAIVGGWPCQGNSLAGARKGMADERSGLVVEVVRLVRLLRPVLVFLENVPGVLTAPGDGVGYVHSELASLGYELRWTDLSAADVGQAHERRRYWLMAFRSGGECERGTGERAWDECHGQEAGRLQGAGQLEHGGEDLGSVGDSADLGHQRPGRARGRRLGSEDAGARLGNHSGRGLQGSQSENIGSRGPAQGQGCEQADRSEGPGSALGEHQGNGRGQEQRVTPWLGGHGPIASGPLPEDRLPATPPGRDDHAAWDAVIALQLDVEPTLRRVAPRVAYRADRIRVVGNGVDFRAAKAAAKALLLGG